MKKYFFSMLAIVVALGFSAFTAHKPSAKKQATYFYYRVNSITNRVESSSDLVNGTAMLPSAFASNFPADACPGNGQDCVRGFTSEIPEEDLPFSGEGEDEFHKQ
jgi:hypothetical protein